MLILREKYIALELAQEKIKVLNNSISLKKLKMGIKYIILPTSIKNKETNTKQ